ncbi:hypothetical protein A3SI_14349 [Nitritalea halalkaliphila LW7]|uniref:Uncharacterized protein n=1 Tax=Nitritalea halalkaliphila LW7 TaxID=1189621 RepID=I5BZU8_9BACT|nr:hypothetical protein A3SI_14349 [Nitritalea halalkaliphila LW7]
MLFGSPLLWLIVSHNEFQEGGFPCTVLAYEANFIFRFYVEGGISIERATSEVIGQIMDGKHKTKIGKKQQKMAVETH